MPRVTLAYDQDIGPVIPVTISDSMDDRREDETPRSENVSMLVDSGASDSSIRGDVADRLGLRVLGLFSVTGFANRASTIQHLADIELWLGDVSYPLSGWKLMRFESDYDKIDGILGRDILERGRFVLDGPAHQFTLEF